MVDVIRAVTEHITDEQKASIEHQLGRTVDRIPEQEAEKAFIVICCNAEQLNRPDNDILTNCHYCGRSIRHSFHSPKNPKKVCERCGSAVTKYLERRQKLEALKLGDEVTRLLAGVIPMKLKVTEVTEEEIKCGDWTFSRKTGYEIDHDLGWDGFTKTGSFLQT